MGVLRAHRAILPGDWPSSLLRPARWRNRDHVADDVTYRRTVSDTALPRRTPKGREHAQLVRWITTGVITMFSALRPRLLSLERWHWRAAGRLRLSGISRLLTAVAAITAAVRIKAGVGVVAFGGGWHGHGWHGRDWRRTTGASRGRLSQPGLLQSQDRPGAGLRAWHQAVDAQELVGAVRLAAHRSHRADRRRADTGGET